MKNNKTWTKEQMEKAEKLVRELMNEAKTEQSVEKNLADSLNSRLDVDGDKIVSGLKEGIRSFYENYETGKGKGLKALTDEKLSSMLEGYDENNQRMLLSDIISACAEISGQEMSDEKLQKLSLGELKGMVQEYICEYAILTMDCEAAELIADELKEKDIKALTDAGEKEKQELYTALAIYILKVTGELEDIPAAVSEQEIGVSTAASFETQSAIHEWLLGKLSWEKVKEKLKLIAGAALLTLMAFIALKLAVFTASFIFIIVQAVVGMGIIGTLTACIFGMIHGVSIITPILEAGKWISEKTGISDKVTEGKERLTRWYHETIGLRLDAFWEKIKKRIAALVTDNVQEEHTSQAQSTQTTRKEQEELTGEYVQA